MRSELSEAWVTFVNVASIRPSWKPLFCKLAQNWAALMETFKISSGRCCTLLHQPPGFALQLLGSAPRVIPCIILWVKIGENEAGSYFFLSCSDWMFLGFYCFLSAPGQVVTYATQAKLLAAGSPCPLIICVWYLCVSLRPYPSVFPRQSAARKIPKKAGFYC